MLLETNHLDSWLRARDLCASTDFIRQHVIFKWNPRRIECDGGRAHLRSILD